MEQLRQFRKFGSALSFLTAAVVAVVSPFSYASYPGLGVAVGGSRVEYEEPGLMSEKGLLWGAHIAFMNPPNEQVSFRVQGSLVLGSMDYEGSLVDLQSGASRPHSTSTQDAVFDIQGDLAAITNAEGAVLFRFYAGLGMRYWQDRIEGAGGYRRYTTYYFLPVGAMASAELGSSLELSVEAQYNVWLLGENQTFLSDLNPAYEDLKFKQNSGSGYQLAVQATLYNTTYRPFARFVYQAWDVEDSEPGITGGSIWYEPKNNTSMFMTMFGMMFK